MKKCVFKIFKLIFIRKGKLPGKEDIVKGIVSEGTVQKWLCTFKAGNFNLKYQEHTGES